MLDAHLLGTWTIPYAVSGSLVRKKVLKKLKSWEGRRDGGEN